MSMRRPTSRVVIVALLGVVWTGALGHAEPATEKAAPRPKETHATKDVQAPKHASTAKDADAPASKDAHAPVVTSATLQPSAHKLSAPLAAHPPSGDAAPDTKKSAGSHEKAGTRSARQAAPPDENEARAARPGLARPPNPALEAVLQRLNRRIAASRSPERAQTAQAGHEPRGSSTAKGPRSAAAPTPTFRLQVTSPHAAEPSATPRVRLRWRPAVIWPRAVLPGGDADARVRVDWSGP